MDEPQADDPDTRSRPAQTVRRLREARLTRERVNQQSDEVRPTALGEDPLMNLSARPRRKRCKYCRYRFDYRMYTNRCPECGRYRDDYPQPNHGLQAMLFAGAVVGVVVVVLGVAAVVRMF